MNYGQNHQIGQRSASDLVSPEQRRWLKRMLRKRRRQEERHDPATVLPKTRYYAHW
jgi:hypothetical protein